MTRGYSHAMVDWRPGGFNHTKFMFSQSKTEFEINVIDEKRLIKQTHIFERRAAEQAAGLQRHRYFSKLQTISHAAFDRFRRKHMARRDERNFVTKWASGYGPPAWPSPNPGETLLS